VNGATSIVFAPLVPPELLIGVVTLALALAAFAAWRRARGTVTVPPPSPFSRGCSPTPPSRRNCASR
jgi:hypothetical protein